MRKTLIIGWDGATWDVLRPWMDEGLLPNLSRLVSGGASSTLTTTIPPVSASAWVSFATGCNPGKHGVFDFVYPQPGSYAVGLTDVTLRGMPPFWQQVEAAGGQVGLISVPITFPPQPLQGFTVCGFLVPGPDSEYTYPRELKRELLSEVGEWPVHEAEDHRGRDNARFCADMLRFDAERTRHALYLMKTRPWDLLAFVMKSPDTLQHEIWHCLDRLHPRHDAAEARVVLPAIRDFYVGLDECVGQLLAAAPSEALVVLLSDHGFGPFHKYFHVNNWLASIGLLKFRRGPWTMLKRLAFGLGLTPVTGIKLSGLLRLNRMRKRMKRGRGRGLLRRLFLSFDDVDWSRTRAFSIGNFGQVYLNVRGERPQGVVPPGEAYETLRDQIIQAALSLRDPQTGDRIIARAYRREEIYRGERLPQSPDIILHTDRARYVSFGHADFGSNRLVDPSVGQTGHHAMDGILVLHGEHILAGHCLIGSNILDIAPTVLYAMGLPVPESMDGSALLEAFDPVYTAGHPVTYSAASEGTARGDGFAPEDRSRIEGRLRELGYMA